MEEKTLQKYLPGSDSVTEEEDLVTEGTCMTSWRTTNTELSLNM